MSMRRLSARGLCRLAAVAWPWLAVGTIGPAVAQTGVSSLDEIVVSADRVPGSIDRTGSAISLVSAADLAATNLTSLVDALRAVPGLDITETGGPGATANVRLRGGSTGQTLVLIDGVRANDPSNASGDFDFAMFPLGAIERIEVLRGPQSALYGSDAIGGVVNIITKRGSGPMRTTATVEGGSYGLMSGIGTISGSTGGWSYAASGAVQKNDGFSRYGYRIPAIEARFPNLERDGFSRFAGSARLGYDSGDGFRFDAGALSSFTRAGLDAATGTFPDTPSFAERWYSQVNARGSLDTLDGRWSHSLNVFANRNDRRFDETTYRIDLTPANTTRTVSDFIGDRIGVEYQSILKAGRLGSLVYGAKVEHETANTFATNLSPVPGNRRSTLAAAQDTRSIFALWQLPVGDRLNLTAGGRIDDIAGVARFETWRVTAAYRFVETGTKLRASAGTGAKAPTLFQLYAPTYGNPTLSPEQSFGYDAGIDQSLLGGRLRLSATAFRNDLQQLIEFNAASMRYFNVVRARTSGLEASADAELLPGYLRLKLAYTNLRAKDLSTNLTLARRPAHVGTIGLSFTPMPGWLIEPRVMLVSDRFNSANETGRLAAYARVDLYTEYRIDANWKTYLRGENVLNARYQEALNYGTTGPALYVGLSGTW